MKTAEKPLRGEYKDSISLGGKGGAKEGWLVEPKTKESGEPSKSRRGPSAKLSSKKKGQIPLKREKFLFLEAGVFS